MTALNTYLTFDGNCQEAFDFYKDVFGNELLMMSYFKDMPEDPNCQISDSDKNKVMHVSLPISDTCTLMGSDTIAEQSKELVQGNNFSISINADSKSDADCLFIALSKNGNVIMPMDDTFWNSYFGMLTDQFGIQWMVSFDQTPNS